LANYRGLFSNILINVIEKRRSFNTNSNNSKSGQQEEEAVAADNLNKRKKYQSWLQNCCKKLKDLNKEHAKVLQEYRSLVQFPDLYSELYNL
jgi:hypothetical protein